MGWQMKLIRQALQIIDWIIGLHLNFYKEEGGKCKELKILEMQSSQYMKIQVQNKIALSHILDLT